MHLYGLLGYPLSHSFSQKYFTEKFQDSAKLLYTLYTQYQIRRVIIRPSFFFGYEIFDHFLFYS